MTHPLRLHRQHLPQSDRGSDRAQRGDRARARRRRRRRARARARGTARRRPTARCSSALERGIDLSHAPRAAADARARAVARSGPRDGPAPPRAHRGARRGRARRYLLTAYASRGASARAINDPFGGDLDVYRATLDELRGRDPARVRPPHGASAAQPARRERAARAGWCSSAIRCGTRCRRCSRTRRSRAAGIPLRYEALDVAAGRARGNAGRRCAASAPRAT